MKNALSCHEKMGFFGLTACLIAEALVFSTTPAAGKTVSPAASSGLAPGNPFQIPR